MAESWLDLDIPDDDSEEDIDEAENQAHEWLALQPPEHGDIASPMPAEPAGNAFLDIIADDVTPAQRNPVAPAGVDGKVADMIVRARRLRPAQRQFIRCLVQSAGAVGAALKLFNARSAEPLTVAQVHRWNRNPDYLKALQYAREQYLDTAGIDVPGVLSRAVRVYEDAMTPAPILFKGRHTGFFEVDRANAMRATEFLGKNVGIGNDDKSTRVTVQIVNLSSRKEDAAEPVAVVDG